MGVQQPCLYFWSELCALSVNPDYHKNKVDPLNESSAFYGFVGNEAAVRRLARVAFLALSKTDHQCSNFSFALLGPASTGKTTLAERFAKCLELPFVKIQPKSITSVNDILVKAAEVCKNFNLEILVENELGDEDDPRDYSQKVADYEKLNYDFQVEAWSGDGTPPDIWLPPMVIFIDEVHALKNGVMQGLLTAIESKDRRMQTEKGFDVDCSRVCWIVATTERGQLFGPFDSRFVKITLDYYTRKQIAEIIHVNYSSWNEQKCELVSQYAGHIPREALDFAAEVEIEKKMSPEDSWKVIVQRVADDRGIDIRTGLTRTRLKIITELAQGPISKSRIGMEARCELEELERFVMPVLLSDVSGEPALVAVCNKGYCLTREGLDFCVKHGITNKGEEALPNGS